MNDLWLTRADELYAQFVAHEGLYGKAFFGHKRSKREAARLQYLWRRAVKQAKEEGGGNGDSGATG